MKNNNINYLIGTFVLLVATTVACCQTDSHQGPPSGPFGGQAPNLPDVAKNVVLGQLKKVEKAKLTIAKPDGLEQSVAVDANTKFVGDHGEAISLADFKTGDQVAARQSQGRRPRGGAISQASIWPWRSAIASTTSKPRQQLSLTTKRQSQETGRKE